MLLYTLCILIAKITDLEELVHAEPAILEVVQGQESGFLKRE